jgi:glycosyltransferase involved in cell wall biosynthesis
MDPESAESLVATVTTLADNPQLTSRLGHSGRQRVLADFNRDVLAGRFLRLMEEMTGEPGTIEFSSDTDQSRKAA